MMTFWKNLRKNQGMWRKNGFWLNVTLPREIGLIRFEISLLFNWLLWTLWFTSFCFYPKLSSDGLKTSMFFTISYVLFIDYPLDSYVLVQCIYNGASKHRYFFTHELVFLFFRFHANSDHFSFKINPICFCVK